MGGFESSSHRDGSGKRLDLIASTRHDEFAFVDYERLISIGMLGCRDALRWHLIEREPFRYDFSSLTKQVAAAKATGMQVVWDYFHYGYPDDLDIFSPQFVARFAAFARATTEFLKSEFGDGSFICPVNEISFFSWIAGQVGVFYPAAKRRGNELKEQLVRSAIAAVREIKLADPTARIVITEPAIHVVSYRHTESAKRAAENYRLAQFHAFDMLLGKRAAELGGAPDMIDVMGLNYYFHNQWYYPSRRKIPPGHHRYKPFREILIEFHKKYRIPILIAETGIEDEQRPEWFRYVCNETRAARSAGAEINGICLYPIVNHPGWADERHCHNGLWDYADVSGDRPVYQPLAEEIRNQINIFESLSFSKST